MIAPPEIAEIAPQPAAVIAVTVARAAMPAAFAAAVLDLRAALTAQGVVATGPLFAHHLERPGETFVLEIGFPVAAPVAPYGRVVAGGLPGGRVARSSFRGDYAGLPAAWSALADWFAANRLTPGATLWEVYTAGPDNAPDPEAWQTDLVRPLA